MQQTNGPCRSERPTKVILYKKNGDKVQMWMIELNKDQYRTTEGFVNGALTTTQWTTALPKNVGKANETSGTEQAIKEVEAKIKLKFEKGYVRDESGEGIRRFEPMLAHKYEDHLKKLAPYLTEDYYIVAGEAAIYSQPKLDGMRCNAILVGEKVKLYSRQGKPINNVKHIETVLLNVLKNNPGIILDGELYNHNLKDDFNTIISHTRKSKPTADDEKACAEVIEYHIYDIINLNKPYISFSDRQNWIKENLENLPHIVEVDTNEIITQAQMDELYAEYREAGYEGQMIRLNKPYVQGRTHNLLKRKEFQDAEFEITDILEGIGNRSGMMGKFILKTENGESFESNALGDNSLYKEYLLNKKNYIGKMATIRYQNLTPRGVPRFPILTSVRDYE